MDFIDTNREEEKDRIKKVFWSIFDVSDLSDELLEMDMDKLVDKLADALLDKCNVRQNPISPPPETPISKPNIQNSQKN